jgi:hypothetical protein
MLEQWVVSRNAVSPEENYYLKWAILRNGGVDTYSKVNVAWKVSQSFSWI